MKRTTVQGWNGTGRHLLVAAVLLAVGAAAPVFSVTRLSGEISGVISKEHSPYYVERDIVVPKDKSCVIEAGCVFLFREFTGIKVFGRLEVNGSGEQMVVFTSERDRSFNRDTALINDTTPEPAAFDWNGMDILEQSVGSVISNAVFRYMVNGIYSRTKMVTINKCCFNFTGTVALRIDEKIFDPTPGTPVSVDGTRLAGVSVVPSTGMTPPGGDSFPKRHKKEIRIGCISLGIAGAVAGVTFGCLAATDYYQATHDIKVGRDSRSAFEDADSRYRKRLKYMAGTLSMGSLGGVGYLLTFNIK